MIYSCYFKNKYSTFTFLQKFQNTIHKHLHTNTLYKNKLDKSTSKQLIKVN